MRLVAENKYSINTFISHARFTVFKTRELLFRHKHCGNNAPTLISSSHMLQRHYIIRVGR